MGHAASLVVSPSHGPPTDPPVGADVGDLEKEVVGMQWEGGEEEWMGNYVIADEGGVGHDPGAGRMRSMTCADEETSQALLAVIASLTTAGLTHDLLTSTFVLVVPELYNHPSFPLDDRVAKGLAAYMPQHPNTKVRECKEQSNELSDELRMWVSLNVLTYIAKTFVHNIALLTPRSVSCSTLRSSAPPHANRRGWKLPPPRCLAVHVWNSRPK
jgi:hypothetical protein